MEPVVETSEINSSANVAALNIHPGQTEPRSTAASSHPSAVVLPIEELPVDTDDISSHFELPSASQIDLAVLDELPEDIKKDLIQEYQRKGVHLGAGPSNNNQPVAGPSHAVTESVPIRLPEKAMSYEGIHQVSDIDASFWSALPDEIKSEIERDIQQRKTEANSPTKAWSAIFKTRRSPTKATSKPTKRKGKAQERFKPKNPVIPRPAVTVVSKKVAF